MPALKSGQSAQLPLDLGHRTALGREDFLVAPSNQSAVAWLDRWPDWTSGGLVVHGPAGCGKTHLAHVWQKVSGAVLLDASALADHDPPDLLGAHKTAIIENAEGVGGDNDLERALFHFFNFILCFSFASRNNSSSMSHSSSWRSCFSSNKTNNRFFDF